MFAEPIDVCRLKGAQDGQRFMADLLSIGRTSVRRLLTPPPMN
jgi:hypothetical protein